MVFTENKDKASKIIREPKDNFPIVVFRDGVWSRIQFILILRSLDLDWQFLLIIDDVPAWFSLVFSWYSRYCFAFVLGADLVNVIPKCQKMEKQQVNTEEHYPLQMKAALNIDSLLHLKKQNMARNFALHLTADVRSKGQGSARSGTQIESPCKSGSCGGFQRHTQVFHKWLSSAFKGWMKGWSQQTLNA